MRDPLDPELDTYSPVEASAVAYAVSKGAVVFAAVGNGDQTSSEPWRFASYPAAQPHVIGVRTVVLTVAAAAIVAAGWFIAEHFAR